jgi:hypothetical protein
VPGLSHGRESFRAERDKVRHCFAECKQDTFRSVLRPQSDQRLSVGAICPLLTPLAPRSLPVCEIPQYRLLLPANIRRCAFRCHWSTVFATIRFSFGVTESLHTAGNFSGTEWESRQCMSIAMIYDSAASNKYGGLGDLNIERPRAFPASPCRRTIPISEGPLLRPILGD